MVEHDPPAEPAPAEPAAPGAAAASPAPATAAPVPEPSADAAPADVTPAEVAPADVAPVDVAPAPAAKPAPPPRVRRCENCETPLLGDTCYACGQPTKGLIRQFGTVFGDFFDTVFNLDSRVFRTLGPLLFKPGYLSQSYFEGHRIRYVSPVRLFVFLSILAFLAAQWNLSADGSNSGIRFGSGDDTTDRIERAQTEAEVIRIRDAALAEFEKAKAQGKDVPGLAAGMEAGAREIRREAQARVMELRAEAAVERELKTAPPGVGKLPGPDGIPGPPPGDDSGISFNDKPWDAKTNPLVVSWLPDAANAKLNGWIGRAKANAERLEESGDGNPLMKKFLGLLPQTLFLMLPMFALLLKAMYFFKRRLYMEHLVVALHSHAFLCLGLLLQFLLLLLEDALAGTGGFVLGVLDWIEVALWVWMPLYLLLMQKRVYRQGWIATGFKFGVVGLVYTMLLGVALLVTMLISLVNM